MLFLPTDTQNTFILSFWSQLNHPSFAQESTVCTKQNLGREYSILPSVTTHSSFTKSVMHGRCVKSGSCSLSSLKWKVNGQYSWDILISQQMSAVIKLVVDTNIICLSENTAYTCPIAAWCAPHSSTATAQNSQLHFSWAMTPTSQTCTQLITRFSLQREYELQVNKNEEIKQWLVEL